MSDDINMEIPEPSRFTKFKRFVKQHDVEIGFAAVVGLTVYGATRAYYGGVVDQVKFSKAILESEHAELGFETEILRDFLASKNLEEKFDAFFRTKAEELAA